MAFTEGRDALGGGGGRGGGGGMRRWSRRRCQLTVFIPDHLASDIRGKLYLYSRWAYGEHCEYIRDVIEAELKVLIPSH